MEKPTPEDEKLTALVEAVQRFARGMTEQDAAKVVAEVSVRWGMRLTQLPDVVGLFAGRTGQSPAAIAFGLHVMGQVFETPEGRAMLLHAADRLVAVEKAKATKTPPTTH